ncbi:MAG: N-formylglutamate amidohydrolase [Nanobdellota archaeon]
MSKLLEYFQKTKIPYLFERISPILIKPKSSSITISLSRRFLLFKLINEITNKIENDPHLNFISLLKYYKVLGKFLEGTIYEFHRDRNKAYFRNFFIHKDVYKKVKGNIEYAYSINKEARMTITKEGITIYNNYRKNKFNILLLTIHAGTFVPPKIQKKMNMTKQERYKEEDVFTDRIYCKLVLEQGGIWINNTMSRFYCDLNRNMSRCIYGKEDHNVSGNIWEKELRKSEIEEIHNFYGQFYSMLTRLLETHSFNIIFDAHSMKDSEGRPNISFGTHYIPKFYLPIVRSIQAKVRSLGYNKVAINKPYGGGFILKWMSRKYPDRFIFSMEINKALYMTQDRLKEYDKRINQLSDALMNIFDIREEEGFRMEKR